MPKMRLVARCVAPDARFENTDGFWDLTTKAFVSYVQFDTEQTKNVVVATYLLFGYVGVMMAMIVGWFIPSEYLA